MHAFFMEREHNKSDNFLLNEEIGRGRWKKTEKWKKLKSVEVEEIEGFHMQN